jgi:hypothetical protein
MQLKKVLESHKGRFVSLLIQRGAERKLHSVKVGNLNKLICFTDTNAGNRRVKRGKILKAQCGDAVFVSKSV